MTVLRRWLPVILVVLFFRAPGYATGTTIYILHTNDIHASFVPHEAAWVKGTPKPMVGGFVRLEAVVDSIRGLGSPTLLLDAGDVMTGNPISEFIYDSAYGGALFAMMNRLHYDVWEPGNHDLDISQDNLRRLTTIAHFPTVSANLVDDRGRYPLNNKPYVVLERGGIRIGVIGLMSEDLYGLVNQQNLTGLRVLPAAETAQKWIDKIRPDVDLVVLLTHEGADEDSILAEKIHGADVIVGGHSHTRIRIPKVVNNIRIVQTGSNCENLGVLKITLDNHKPAEYWGTLVPLWCKSQEPVEPVTGLVDSLRAAIDKRYSEVLGTLSQDWHNRGAFSPLASFVTEAQRTAASAQVSFMNVHGIRKDLLAGPVTRRDIFEVLPFRNVIVTFQLTGAQLLSILHYYLEDHPAIIITGLSATWKKDAKGTIVLSEVKVGSDPLEKTRMYICAASDFFVGEAKKYLGMEITNGSVSSTTLFSAVEQAVRKEKHLQAIQAMKIGQAP
jgi:5'-nucleotidase/UDP-sugar diphosphatase